MKLTEVFATHSYNDFVKVKLRLDKEGIAYTIRNQQIFGLQYGFGEAAFWVWEHEREKAIFAIAQSDICTDTMLTSCPACEAEVPAGKLECVKCGLFLG